MIAKVRIAPVERWCQTPNRQYFGLESYRCLVGMEVEIFPSSMIDHSCGTHGWLLTPDSYQKMRQICPHAASRGYACEHTLEMD